MTIFEMDVTDVVEPTVLPAGEEAKIRITAVKADNDKNGNPYFLPTFEVADDPSVKEFTKFYSVPRGDMDAKKLNNSKLAIKRLCEAMDIDPTKPFDTDSLIGRECWAILGIEENAEYGDKNYIKKFIAAK